MAAVKKENKKLTFGDTMYAEIMEVKIYGFITEISGIRYGGEISARSVEEAQSLVPTATEVEEIVETYEYVEPPLFCMQGMQIH